MFYRSIGVITAKTNNSASKSVIFNITYFDTLCKL